MQPGTWVTPANGDGWGEHGPRDKGEDRDRNRRELGNWTRYCTRACQQWRRHSSCGLRRRSFGGSGNGDCGSLRHTYAARAGECGRCRSAGARRRSHGSGTGPTGYSRFAVRPYPKEWEQRLALVDGTRIFARPLRPEDEASLHAFLQRVNAEDLHLRFSLRSRISAMCSWRA